MIYISTFNRFFHSDYIWNHIINWKFDTHTSDFRSFLVELFRRRDGNMKRRGKAMMDKWWLLFSIELFVYSILYTFLCSVMCARACASLGVQILRSGLQINRIKKHCNLGQRYTLPASTFRKPLCCTQKVTGFRDGVYCQRKSAFFRRSVANTLVSEIAVAAAIAIVGSNYLYFFFVYCDYFIPSLAYNVWWPTE